MRTDDRHTRAGSIEPIVRNLNLSGHGPLLIPVSEAERKLLDPENKGRYFVRVHPRSVPPLPGSRQPYQGPERRRPVPLAPPFAPQRPDLVQQVQQIQPSVGTFGTRPFVYRPPELPHYIPPPLAPRRLPLRTNCHEILRPLFLTNKEGLDRIGIHSGFRIFGTIRHFMIDVRAFGFMVLYTDPKRRRPNTLVLCSPSGHVHIVQEHNRMLSTPSMINDLLYKDDAIKKISLYKDDTEAFLRTYGMPNINVIEIRPVIRKNLREIRGGVMRFLKYDLGPDIPFEWTNVTNDDHLRTVATNARAIAYGVWLVALRLVQRAELSAAANISGYMRFALFSELEDGYRQLTADPYYVPLDENYLSPTHQADLDEVLRVYRPVHSRALKTFRPRFLKPFQPMVLDLHLNCMTCSLFVKPGTSHECKVTPNCPYPTCDDNTPHSPLMCKYIKSWCIVCQRRGHLAKHHETSGLPPPYLWALFLHYQSINLDTSYVMKDKKYEKAFFHMFTLYGLPPSKLPKAAYETAIGKDKPAAKVIPLQSLAILPNAPKQEPSIIYRSIPPRPSPPPGWVVTRFELQQAMALAERVSRGEIAGTSGCVQATPVVTDLLRFVEKLKTPRPSSTQAQPLVDTKQVQSTSSGQLTTSVAARQAPLAGASSQSQQNDRGSPNPSVVEANATSDSETEPLDTDDDPDGDVIFDNQEHILDRPITDSELQQAIDPNIPYPGCYRGPNNGPPDEPNNGSSKGPYNVN